MFCQAAKKLADKAVRAPIWQFANVLFRDAVVVHIHPMISRGKAVALGLLGLAFGALLLTTFLPSKNELALPDGSRLILVKTTWNKPVEGPPWTRTERMLLRYVPENVRQLFGIRLSTKNVTYWSMGGTNMLGFLFLQTGGPKTVFSQMIPSVSALYISNLPVRVIDDAGVDVQKEKLELYLFPWRPGCNYLATVVRLGREHGRNITLRIYKRNPSDSDPVFGPVESDYQTILGDFTVRNPAF